MAPAADSLREARPRLPVGAGVFGRGVMLQLTPKAASFSRSSPSIFEGIEASPCLSPGARRQSLGGAVYVFRKRTARRSNSLAYDGQGFWLCTKRLSQGGFHWWPTAATPSRAFVRPGVDRAVMEWLSGTRQMAPEWRQVA